MLDDLDWVAQQRDGKLLGYETGFPKLTAALDGLQPGLYMLPAAPNVGKSAFALQLAWQVALLNNNAYVLYITLDDPESVIIQRLVASVGNIPVRAVLLPKAYEHDPAVCAARERAMHKARHVLSRMAVVDRTQNPDVHDILKFVEDTMIELGSGEVARRPVVFIDNAYDLTVQTRSDSRMDRFELVNATLKQFVARHRIPVVCTAEIRKLNGIRRPILEDLKENNKIAYRADCVIAPFNELGFRKHQARIFWVRGSERMPVLELEFIKNKIPGATFKGRLFYKFTPECSHLEEVDNPAQEAAWNAQIR